MEERSLYLCAMRAFILIMALSVAGCATSAQGLYESPVEGVITSNRSSADFATCVAERLSADVSLRSQGDHYWVLRSNLYGVPITRWDFFPTEGGSRAELRTSINAGTGKGDVSDCA